MQNLFAALAKSPFCSHSILIRTLFLFVAIVACAADGNFVFAQSEDADLIKWIRTAEKTGQLTLDFYDPLKRKQAYPGWTDYRFSLEYQFEHQTRWKQNKGKSLSVTIVPTFTTINSAVTHVVKLPQSIGRNTWHESFLGRHELDHVAIGSHPRIVMLSNTLLKNMGTLNRNVEKVSEVTREWIAETVRAEVNERTKAIQLLILTNNEKLDELTDHGGRGIREREAFFGELYLRENLDECKFPYLAESLKLLETAEDRDAKSIFDKK